MQVLAQVANDTPSTLLAWPILLFIGAMIALLGRSLSGRLRRMPTSFQEEDGSKALVPRSGSAPASQAHDAMPD